MWKQSNRFFSSMLALFKMQINFMRRICILIILLRPYFTTKRICSKAEPTKWKVRQTVENYHCAQVKMFSLAILRSICLSNQLICKVTLAWISSLSSYIAASYASSLPFLLDRYIQYEQRQQIITGTHIHTTDPSSRQNGPYFIPATLFCFCFHSVSVSFFHLAEFPTSMRLQWKQTACKSISLTLSFFLSL